MSTDSQPEGDSCQEEVANITWSYGGRLGLSTGSEETANRSGRGCGWGKVGGY